MRIVTWQQQQGKNSYRLIGGAKKQKKTNKSNSTCNRTRQWIVAILFDESKKKTNLILEGIFKEKLMGHI